MSIRLAIADRAPLDLDEDNIILGSDPSCTVAFTQSYGVMPKHAVIRKIAGRWLIEAREAESVFIAGSEPKRLHWLNPGDVIHLSGNCPAITFQPANSQSVTPTHQQPVAPKTIQQPVAATTHKPPATPVNQRPPGVNDVILPPDSDAEIPVTAPRHSAPTPARSTPAALSDEPLVGNPPSSGTVRSVRIESFSTEDEGNADSAKGETISRGKRAPVTPVANMPAQPLQRHLSGDDFPDLDVSPERLSITDPNSEINWIMMVIGWSAAGGFLILILWLAISFIWSAIQAPKYGSPPTAPPPTQQ